MSITVTRRNIMQLAGLAGATYMSGLFPAIGNAVAADYDDFHFVQFSDTHWGYAGPANPDSAHTLEKAIATVNVLAEQPDFIVFTGDLTHTTDDPKERRARLARFREIVSALRVKTIRFMPGEHDASLDQGAAYREFFGDSYYSFDHKGVHFIALDNVSDPHGAIGDAQLAWLAADLQQHKAEERIVVFTHRPLFDLAPEWDWATKDGAKAIKLLMPFQNVAVFYGHIHQEHHQMTGHIAHHAAKSLIFPLPAPGSQPRKLPVPWNPEHGGAGLGTREVELDLKSAAIEMIEHPVQEG